MEKYRNISLKVKNWGRFTESDLERNEIEEIPTYHRDSDVPEFVRTFEQKLTRKPRLPPDVPALINPEEFFAPYEGSHAQEETRQADLSEVVHTVYHIAFHDWNQPSFSFVVNARVMDLIFFGPLLTMRATTAQRDRNWPITIVVERTKVDREPRTYRPRSDFLFSNSRLPRLLVDVEDEVEDEMEDDFSSQSSMPMKLVRMLMTGAFVVRFANNFVSTFSEKKNFVLCAFFVNSYGGATRYTLFQDDKQPSKVYYRNESFSFSGPLGRVEFARHLYSILSVEFDPVQDKATRDAVYDLENTVRHCYMTSMHTDKNDPDEDDYARLRAHGYKVEPEVVIDELGGKWEPLVKSPDHILTVYRPRNEDEKFIAKQVWSRSNELEILRFLKTIPRKSDNVIPLIDSFDGWAILPKMTTIQHCVSWKREGLKDNVYHVCMGLVKGLAYLHEHRVAHRDIKPDNLVVDHHFNPKIIDFGVAMRVEDEKEKVSDRCGTHGWIAPEVEMKLRHSPIKADRWACGLVIKYLNDGLRIGNPALKTFQRALTAYNPDDRRSLLEWDKYLVPESSHAGSPDARKDSPSEPSEVESEGEDTRSPKRRRLESESST